MTKFNISCPRCNGEGRYDRGTCFECRGRRFVTRTRKPKGEPTRVRVTVDGRRIAYDFYGLSQEVAQTVVASFFAAKGHTMTRDFKGNEVR